MKKNTAIPAIRFKGFTAPWEQRELGNIFKYEQPQAYIVKNTKYNESFKIPVLTAGQSFILGYTDENFGVKNASSESPVIIFDDFTTASHFVDFSFKIKSSAMKLLTLNNPNDNVQCAYQILQNLSYTPLTHSRHWISTFSKFKVLIPESHKEQNQIGALFSNLERLITLHQRKLKKLHNIKKSMLEKMFPQKGSCYPEIRFKGFTAPWEQRKFEEIAVRSSSISSNVSLPRIEYEDIVSGTGQLNKDIYAKDRNKPGLAFHPGDILYGKLRPYLKNWLLPAFNGLAVGDFWVLEPQNIDSKFLYCLIQIRQFDAVANQSTGTKMPRADWKLVSKTTFSIPSSTREQATIGAYFAALDTLITLHQRKLKKLHNIKKSMLEKMFV